MADDKALRLARLILHAAAPDFAVRLWNGERSGPAQGPVLALNDPALIGRLLRRPTIDTLVEAWASKALDVEGGTLFELHALRPQNGFKARLRALPKLQLLRDLPSIWIEAGRARPQSDLAGRDAFASGSSKEAIAHHYDISNAFYRLFLDERMLYSCAYFTDFSNGIDQAQRDKLDHICRKLRLKPGDRFLDIGCGWGALLIHAAKYYSAVCHGVSLSEAQTALARERIRAEGLEDRIRIDLKSYTELDGAFDKIASIGMFEHIGLANHDAYFRTVRKLLAPGGIYLHHAITRRMKKTGGAFRRKAPGYKAILKYVFPGAELDHIGMSIQNLEAHGFEVHDVENLREHYARTCRLWAERLAARFDEAIAEVGEPRARLWLLYLSGCSLGFEDGSIRIYQTVATRRGKGASGLPPTRADLYR
jgi:cyclopropane-fatty-acyl-phospholipid synthase